MSRTEVQTINEEFGKAVANNDVRELLDFYDDNARVLPPNSPLLQGKPAIGDFFRGLLEAGVTSLELDSIEVLEAGDILIDVGRYRLRVETAGAGVTDDVGKYVVVFRRQSDGRLRMIIDTFNSDLPTAT